MFKLYIVLADDVDMDVEIDIDLVVMQATTHAQSAELACSA